MARPSEDRIEGYHCENRIKEGKRSGQICGKLLFAKNGLTIWDDRCESTHSLLDLLRKALNLEYLTPEDVFQSIPELCHQQPKKKKEKGVRKRESNSSQTGISVKKRRVTDYTCNVCKTTYQNKKYAIDCSSLPIEKKIFELGDVVRWRELRTCSQYSETYTAEGKIIKIELVPPDAEYIGKWLNSTEYIHNWLVTFKFKCPHCSGTEGMQAYQEELIKVG